MRATRHRTGAVRLQALQAEVAAAIGKEKPAKSLASYFSAPVSSKSVRPKSLASEASA